MARFYKGKRKHVITTQTVSCGRQALRQIEPDSDALWSRVRRDARAAEPSCAWVSLFGRKGGGLSSMEGVRIAPIVPYGLRPSSHRMYKQVCTQICMQIL